MMLCLQTIFVYAKRAEQLIQNHNVSVPMFLYMAFQSVHSPIEVPAQYEKMYQNVTDVHRRQFLGMVTAMDEAIGRMVKALSLKGILEDTLIVFTADNGGMPLYPYGGGNNYPLRGAKTTVFEGGTRASAFISGVSLQHTGITYNGLIHAVDWHSSLIGAAGGEPETNTDSMNHWDELRTGLPTKREELVYNLDDSSELPLTGHAAIRVGDFKLIDGFPGYLTSWYPPPERNVSNPLYKSPTGKTLYEGDGLYNVKDDPTERHDVSAQYPDIVHKLKARLDEYRKQYVAPMKPPDDPQSDPSNFGGFWAPGWC